MPDIPESQYELDPIAHQKGKSSTSKPYRGHPTLTTKQFLALSWQEQRAVDAELEAKAGLKHHTIKPPDGPAYVVRYTDQQSGER